MGPPAEGCLTGCRLSRGHAPGFASSLLQIFSRDTMAVSSTPPSADDTEQSWLIRMTVHRGQSDSGHRPFSLRTMNLQKQNCPVLRRTYFLSHLKATCRPEALSLADTETRISPSKGILLHRHNSAVRISKWTLNMCYSCFSDPIPVSPKAPVTCHFPATGPSSEPHGVFS